MNFTPPAFKYDFHKMEVGDALTIPFLAAGWVQSKRGKKKWRCRARAAVHAHGTKHGKIFETKSDSERNLTVRRVS